MTEVTRTTAHGRSRFTDGWLVALITGVLFLGCAVYLSINDLIFPDNMSRVANGYYVLFSRDPHLAAIGFVWNPLPSLLVIPLLVLNPIFPVLAAKGFAGVIVSAGASVWAMVLARRILASLGVGRVAAIFLTLLLAAQPLVLLSAASGASEALLLLAGMYVVQNLLLWLSQDDPWHLTHIGLGLGLAYLIRYEGAAAALAVTIVVLVVSLWRSRGGRRRKSLAILDTFLVAMPFGAAFIGWAVTSRIVAGSWFATYSSRYGNSAQVESARATIDQVTGGTLGDNAAYLATQLVTVAPLTIPLVVVGLIVAAMRRDARILAPCAVFGAILIFDEVVFLNHGSFGWLRFQIMAIPLGVLAAGYLIGMVARPVRRQVASVVLALALAVPYPLAVSASLNRDLAREEALAQDSARAGQYKVQAEVAAYIDSLGLPDGSVVTDVAYLFSIVLASKDPRVFVVTPDRDFPAAVADPWGHGVKYALVTLPHLSAADAVAARFPGIFEDGGGVATLDREWVDGSGNTWRLYKFNGS